MALKGTLADFGIIDLIQFPHSGRRSGQLVITTNERRAYLYYEKGALVHASLDDERGADVLVQIVDWIEGDFEFRNDIEAEERSIDVDLHRALMQALKKRDEKKKQEEEMNTAQLVSHTNTSLRAIQSEVSGFMTSADFAVHACVLSGDGSVLVELDGQNGSVDSIAEIRSSLHSLALSYPAELKRIFVEDSSHTVVLFRLQEQASLIVVASKDAPLGAVVMSVGKLAARLG